MSSSPEALRPLELARALTQQARSIHELLAGRSPASMRWKASPTAWSLLECLHHLLDEERRDFRLRIQRLMADEPWPGIDPEAWVLEHAYNEQDPARILAEFQAERAASVHWIQGLEALDLERTREHPQLGPLSVGDLFAAWLAHDLLHLGQLTRSCLALHRQQSAPFRPDYAGG